MTAPIRVETLRDGQVERIVLARPKGNVLDGDMLSALRAAVRDAGGRDHLKLILFEAEGAHFSYGASVCDHLPDRVRALLRAFHGLFRDLEKVGVPTAAVVRGQCLGGGFELATSCGHVVCDPTARFAVPEVTLGVFPPIAVITLPWRLGGARSTDLVVTGRTVTGAEAAGMGLVEACVADPEEAVWRWFDEHLAARSAVGIRYAWRASRRPIARALQNQLPQLEALYLDELMTHADPVEGLTAFVERRPPVWRHA